MKTHPIKLLILLLFCFGLAEARAQEAVIATGGNAAGSGGSASHSVGQIVYTTATGTNGSANHGVQQPYEFFIVGLDENPGINLQLNVYPNPTPSQVTLNIGNLDPKEMIYRLYDSRGKLLISSSLREELTEIPTGSYSNGTYLLQVYNGKSLLRTFKIIKN